MKKNGIAVNDLSFENKTQKKGIEFPLIIRNANYVSCACSYFLHGSYSLGKSLKFRGSLEKSSSFNNPWEVLELRDGVHLIHTTLSYFGVYLCLTWSAIISLDQVGNLGRES